MGTLDERFYAMPVQVTATPVKVVSSATSLVNNFKLGEGKISATNSCVLNKHNTYSMWRYRLGHALVSKLKHIDTIPVTDNDNMCVTCPMEKMCKIAILSEQYCYNFSVLS